jgi:hypothetical protein
MSCHASRSSLRRMPKMPHSIPAWIESVFERVVLDTAECKPFGGMHPVLLVYQAAYLQSMGLVGVETV